jgi:AraC family ethanolamine operon transcriptional activator
MDGMPAGGLLPVLARDQRFDTPEAFGAGLRGGEFEYLRVDGQPYGGRLRQLLLGDTLLQHAQDGAHITRGAVQRGLVMLLWPLSREPGAPRLNGVDVAQMDVALLRGGMELYAHCPARYGWAALGIAEAELEQLAELAPSLARLDRMETLRLAPGAAAELTEVLHAAAELVAGPPDGLPGPDQALVLAAALRDATAMALTAPGEWRPRPRGLRAAVRLVAEAEAFLDAHRGRPVFVAELCEALGASPRKLQNAFLATVGISPQAYLKRRRLTQARAALRGLPDRPGRVKAVALDHGFWHLGHFAADYRALFGEAPSRTMGGEATPPG